ncbi:MAG: iron-sulfur cluster insertion protein ErpA [Chloroflexi bacterium]|nr:iron-sulfur cluster insertion protein ErpA [Chloroflexota bacterium]
MDTQTIPVTTAVEEMTVQPTVNLSPLAAEKLQSILREKNLPGYGLRVFVSGGGCSGFQYGMAFENTTEEGDFVFEASGVRMYLDSASAMYLDGANVDYVDSLMGGGFRIENPNAVSTCSCGQSFSAGAGEGAQASGGGCGCGHH